MGFKERGNGTSIMREIFSLGLMARDMRDRYSREHMASINQVPSATCRSRRIVRDMVEAHE